MNGSRLLRTLAAALLAGSFQGPTVAQALSLIETPSLASAVESGQLPPVADRIPQAPQVVELTGEGREPGIHGGELHLLLGGQKDIRMVTVYGYARLIGFNDKLELVPDILESLEVEESRVFTFRIRPGHRWSDGHPFTSEDFRYFWEDVINNEALTPFGPPPAMTVDGHRPTVELLDESTVRYSWPTPNPLFVTALAGARPLYIYRPAHYLKQFHVRYADPAELQAKVEAASKRNWAALHNRMDNQYNADNVDLPSLQPWVNTTPIPSDRFVFERNPYYHRVDRNGRQLPYIDRVIATIANSRLIPAKAGFGETDLQGRNISFEDYTFLKVGEKDHDFSVRLWRTASGAKVALYPNLNCSDPVWRALNRDVRFRRALSLGIDRHKVNQVVFFGLARESANTVLPESPLFREEYQQAWARFDPAEANALLDEIGLTEWDGGVRLLPDGQRLEIIVDSSGESTEETDVLELIKQDWQQIGVQLFTKTSQREVFYNRVFAGSAIMSVWAGLENAVPTPVMSPQELAPTMQTQLQWSKWGQYVETYQSGGEAPDLPEAVTLARLNEQWRLSSSDEERERIWHRMLGIHSEQVFSIGVVNGVAQPIVVSDHLRNVPVEGLYNYDPGAYFGIHRPDSFWFAEGRRE